MTSKQKNTHLLLLCAIVFLFSIAWYTVSISEGSALVLTMESQEKHNMALGETMLFPVSYTDQQYLYLEAGANDTFQVTFHSNKGEETLIINTGSWTSTATEDGAVPLLHLIPEYIRIAGFQEISLVPIRGDGDYYVQNLQLVQTQEDWSGAHNLIDFEIKKYDITMSEEAYAKIEAERKEALDLGLLFTDDDSYVTAKISAGGENFSTDLRLKGDWTDHLGGDKWSFRVEVKGDFAIWGLQKFSLQPLETRNGIWEYLIYELYREQGGVALRYDFADVTINGVYMGVFAVEEFMEKRVIENSLNREGPIIKLNEGPFWTRFAYYNNLTAPWKDYGVASTKKTVASETLNRYASYAITLVTKYKQGEISVDDVFDVDKMIELSAILDLFSSHHGRAEHNMRFYYNPVSGLLEPIPFDEIANPGEIYYSFFSEPNSSYTDTGELFQKAMIDILAEPENQAYASQVLLDLAQDFSNYLQRQKNQVQQFITTVQRDNSEFVMNLSAIDSRIQQVLSFHEGIEPGIFINSENNTVVISNHNYVNMYVSQLEIDGADPEEIQGTFFIPAQGELIFQLSYHGKWVQLAWETSFTSEKKGASLGIDLAFFSIGHLYGGIYSTTGLIHDPVANYLESLNKGQMDFAVFTGDISRDGAGYEYAQICQVMESISVPLYAVPGNHDLISKVTFDEYDSTVDFIFYFTHTFGYDLWGNQLFIYLDVYENLQSNGCYIPQEQLDMVAEALARYPQVDNVFVGLHQLMFYQPSLKYYGSFYPNSLVGYEETGENNFYTDLQSLFQVNDCPVYFIAGDTGAFANGNELFYEEDGRFTYLSNGVGGGTADSVLEFYVYHDGSVDIRLIALNHQDPNALGNIQDYTKG